MLGGGCCLLRFAGEISNRLWPCAVHVWRPLQEPVAMANRWEVVEVTRLEFAGQRRPGGSGGKERALYVWV